MNRKANMEKAVAMMLAQRKTVAGEYALGPYPRLFVKQYFQGICLFVCMCVCSMFVLD